MNVLQVSKYYYPEVGGIEQVVRTLAAGLDGPRCEMEVLATTPQGLGSTGTVDGVPVRTAASLGELLSVPLAPLFPIELAAAGHDADIIHFHLPNPVAVVSQLLLGPRDPTVVVTYHSDIVKQATALEFYRPLLHRFLDRADHIVTTSPGLLERSEHLAPHAEKCSIVPLSIDLDEFGRSIDTDDTTDSALPTDPDRPTLLFVGRLNYYKGVEYLIDAMRSVDAQLLVVGDGERRTSLERQAREHGLADDITFLGKVPDDTLKRCYAAADVFVLPSVAPSEAFGVVQLEAMAYGTPVVNTDLPTGVPWVSTDGETGLTVPPKDADALADAITRLLSDPDLRERYGENARTRVEQRFSRDVMLDAMAAVYEDVLD